MRLRILFKDGTTKEIIVSTVWQDERHQNYLYYETYADEKGKGTFIELKPVVTWQVEACDIGAKIEL
jgi:hypothetical protein